MALQKTKTLESDLSVDHWVIKHLHMLLDSEKASMDIAAYKDSASRVAGKTLAAVPSCHVVIEQTVVDEILAITVNMPDESTKTLGDYLNDRLSEYTKDEWSGVEGVNFFSDATLV